MERKTMILTVLYVLLPLLDVLSYAEETLRAGATRLDCVRASEQCLKEQACSTKYRTMRQCVAGGKESNFSMVAGLEAKDECRSAMDALKQSPLYNCRCKRGMKKEKNCLRIYWGIYQTLQGNDFLEDSPYEPVNSRLSDIFRLAPIIGTVRNPYLFCTLSAFTFSYLENTQIVTFVRQRVGNLGAALPLPLQEGGATGAGYPRAESPLWAEGAPPPRNFRIPVETGELIPIGPYWGLSVETINQEVENRCDSASPGLAWPGTNSS
ncbi:hypothetical protein PAMA_002140 [Pampus argenteus]